MDWLGILHSLWPFTGPSFVPGAQFWLGKMTGALTPDLASARVRDESEALCGVPESIQATIFKQKRAKTKAKKNLPSVLQLTS